MKLPMRRHRSTSAWIVVAFTVSMFVALSWRATLPPNQHQPANASTMIVGGEVHRRLLDPLVWFDDVATQVTARNFARDVSVLWQRLRRAWREGFSLAALRQALPPSHFLPDRSGAPNASFYGQQQHMCESVSPDKPAPLYRNLEGHWVPMQSLSSECLYVHYPPLADWLYGVAASLGFRELVHYKLIAITLNCALLLLVYWWLRREVAGAAASMATMLVGTLPAFFHWADTLYYQPLQYFLLFAGMLSWGTYLRSSRRRWYALSWICFFCESLASYELTLFFAIMLVGLIALDGSSIESRWRRLAAIAGQATAPVLAFAGHTALTISAIGRERAIQNLIDTLFHRVSVGRPDGFLQLWARINSQLMPVPLVVAGVLMVVVSRRHGRAPLVRPLALLGLLLAGGLSFIGVFAGTASRHAWMMYRHLLPFTCFLLALVADTLLLGLRGAKASWWTAAGRRFECRPTTLASAAIGLLWIGWVTARNVRSLSQEVAWNCAKLRAYDVRNLARALLDVTHWESAGRGTEGLSYLPVAGPLEQEPPGWMLDARMRGPGASHYEIWWLTDQAIQTIRLRVDEAQLARTAERCAMSWYDGTDFRGDVRSVRDTASADLKRADGNGTQRAAPGAWMRFALPAMTHTRAVRLTCIDADRIALRELGVYSS